MNTLNKHSFRRPSVDNLAACAGMAGATCVGLAPYMPGDMAKLVFLANVVWLAGNPIALLHNYKSGEHGYAVMFGYYIFWAVIGVLGGVA